MCVGIAKRTGLVELGSAAYSSCSWVFPDCIDNKPLVLALVFVAMKHA